MQRLIAENPLRHLPATLGETGGLFSEFLLDRSIATGLPAEAASILRRLKSITTWAKRDGVTDAEIAKVINTKAGFLKDDPDWINKASEIDLKPFLYGLKELLKQERL